ncbi:MAG: acyl carrier protein [Eubacterium sp.]|nr:acyl carrier protein [Eubacterium sp.]
MLDKMREIIAEQLSVEEDEINLDTSFREDLGADSLDLYELAELLKDEYDVEIPEEEVANLLTVGDVINFLKEHGIE